jgi:hypothetical protein
MSAQYNRKVLFSQHGGALPLSLFMTLTLALIGGITMKVSQFNLRKINIAEATQDTFQIAEGTAHTLLSQMASSPELWRELNPLEVLPLNYTEYSPSSFSATNGIPTCSGQSCHRNYYPTGGGLVKNFGPLSGSGSQVDALYEIADQFDQNNPPIADTVLNSLSGWVQVERLDEINISSSSLGGGLENNRSGGSRTGVVRFRLSAIATRELRDKTGRSTLVMVVQLPAT